MSVSLRPLYHSADGPLRVVGLMSGSGTNLVKILEREHLLRGEQGKSPYMVVAIFTDNPASKAQEIGERFRLPVEVHDIKAFYAERGKPRKDMATRAEFDAGTVEVLRSYGATAAAYAGYMSVASPVLVQAFLGINVHPADLSILDGEGRRKYRGDHAVLDAILDGQRELRASTHLIAEEVDGGLLFMRSRPLAVALGRDFAAECGSNPRYAKHAHDVAKANQSMLKEVGDWDIFPLTLQLIADRRYCADPSGKLHFDGRPIPHGVAREDLRLG